MYSVCVWRQGGGVGGGGFCVQGPGSKCDVRTYVAEPDGRRVNSVTDAQLHTDLNVDTVDLQLEMYHILFFV